MENSVFEEQIKKEVAELELKVKDKLKEIKRSYVEQQRRVKVMRHELGVIRKKQKNKLNAVKLYNNEPITKKYKKKEPKQEVPHNE